MYIGCNFLHEIFCLYYIKFSNILCYILLISTGRDNSLFVCKFYARMG